MRKSPLVGSAIALSAIIGFAGIAKAIDEPHPTPPQTQANQPPHRPAKNKTVKKPKPAPQKSGSADDFLAGYHAAYAMIYDKGDYGAGIAALRACKAAQ